ncbi:cobalamin biosynthesis protein [Pseudomonas sp. REB1044]|uniref:cobalamin biosynthesis protein n=1 Tax=Pseudomonas sp. REB1044 TaxID=2675224 RepID=UPI00315C8B40
MSALYAGFGCRRGCSVEVLEHLLRRSLAAHGLAITAVRGIASIALKADEPGLSALSRRLALPLVCYDAQQLRPFLNQLSHRSEISHKTTGCWGVAESAALALAGGQGDQPRLRISRQVFANATLAIACNG